MKRLTITRRGIFAGVGGLLASPAIVRAQGQNGVALVIGNSKYLWEAQLPNVKRDAPDMAKRFQALGLQTVLLQDASLEAMRQAVEKFKAAASGANLAVFYFAGHGVTWANESYLVPTDTDLNTPGVVKTLIPVPSITEATQGAAHRLLVFDNCRNNPADGWRQLEAHRAATINQEAQSKLAAQSPNTLSLYSTSPGRVALDGPAGENSPFAAALLRQLEGQSVDLQTLPGQLRRDLLIATQGRQLVWDRSTYQQPFAFRGLGSGATANRSGWNGDPSRIVELTKAYAFAQENKILLPPGLIAHRLANDAASASKVGSFKTEIATVRGRYPYVLVVMSVEEERTAEIVVSGEMGYGPQWLFRTATLSGKRLEYTQFDRGARFVFDWSNANSGTMAQVNESQTFQGYGSASQSSRFSRLDG